MTHGNVSAELSRCSGDDAYAVRWAVVNGERCKQATQRRACDDKQWQGKNSPHGSLQSEDRGLGGATRRERYATAWAGSNATPCRPQGSCAFCRTPDECDVGLWQILLQQFTTVSPNNATGHTRNTSVPAKSALPMTLPRVRKVTWALLISSVAG